MLSTNDDMDELFRRAADSYPLNTNGADWEKVRENMETDKKEDGTSSSNATSGKWYKKLFLLLFLLPLVWICNKYPDKHDEVVSQNDGNISSVLKTGDSELSSSNKERKASQQRPEDKVDRTLVNGKSH